MAMLTMLLILLFGHTDTVTATTYKLTRAENGPYGNNMASGYKVSYKHPGKNRILAVSRDLLKKYPFHTVVVVRGAGKLNGKWIVEDVMNERFTKRIDFLIGWKTKHTKFNNVTIKSYGKHKGSIRHRKRRVNAIHNVRAKQHHHKAKNRNRRSKSSKRFTNKS